MKGPHFFCVSSGHPDDFAGQGGIWATTYLSVSKSVFYIMNFNVECNSKLEKLLKAAYRWQRAKSITCNSPFGSLNNNNDRTTLFIMKNILNLHYAGSFTLSTMLFFKHLLVLQESEYPCLHIKAFPTTYIYSFSSDVLLYNWASLITAIWKIRTTPPCKVEVFNWVARTPKCSLWENRR